MKARNIPAHAGKTYRLCYLSIELSEHPRTRGENPTPPPTGVGRARNIPAHAGKTTPKRGCTPQSTEHPRTRGENGHRFFVAKMHAGTSPHTRGKPQSASLRDLWIRNIPAHAGKTRASKSVLVIEKEHPRTRGENATVFSYDRSAEGTSPHTRGKHDSFHW